MKLAVIGALGIAFLVAGCRPSNPDPDQIRNDTAKATRTAVRDAKAITQGVVDGVRGSGAVNLNTATRDQLETLTDVDEERANRIIANRPYDRPEDLLRKHVVPQAEFNRIKGQVKVK